jgi:hypothetical protein
MTQRDLISLCGNDIVIKPSLVTDQRFKVRPGQESLINNHPAAAHKASDNYSSSCDSRHTVALQFNNVHNINGGWEHPPLMLFSHKNHDYTFINIQL